jgi:hypothetical protein
MGSGMAGAKAPVRFRGTRIGGVRIARHDSMEDVIEKMIRAWRKRTPFRFSEFAKEVESRFGIKVTFEPLGTVSNACGSVCRARHQYVFAHIAGRRHVYRLCNIVWVDDKKDDPVIAFYTRVERVSAPA